jgi:hypothetical protein
MPAWWRRSRPGRRRPHPAKRGRGSGGAALADIASIANPSEREARTNAIRREVLERLIDDQLLAQQATELKLTVSNDEIDRAIEQIKRDYGLNDTQLKDELRKQGLSMPAYRIRTPSARSSSTACSTSPWAPRSTSATARCRATTTAT